MDESAAAFRVELVRAPNGVVVVQAAGEVDFYTGTEFRKCVFDAIEGGTPRVAVDLTDVDFIDSAGLGVLVGASRRSAEEGVELTMVCPPGRVARVVEITGLNHVFTIYSTRQEALGEGPSEAEA